MGMHLLKSTANWLSSTNISRLWNAIGLSLFSVCSIDLLVVVQVRFFLLPIKA